MTARRAISFGMLAIVTLLAAVACAGCGDGCRSLESAGTSAAGTVAYTTGEGTRFEDHAAELWGTGRSTVEVRGQLGARAFRLTLSGLASGTTRTLTHDEAAELCLPLAAGAPPTCLFLDGTVETTTLTVGPCEGNESITLCERAVDVTVHATSHDLGLAVSVDLVLRESTHWQKNACGPD